MALKQVLQGRGLPHPLHPMLVHFPVGLWGASLIFDIASKATGNPNVGNGLVITSYYCILVGVIVAGLAAVTGLAEFIDIPRNTRARSVGLIHFALNVGLLAGYIIQLIVRDTHAASVGTGVFVFNIIETVVLLVSGYYGGKLAFEYGVGTRTSINPQTERAKLRRVA